MSGVTCASTPEVEPTTQPDEATAQQRVRASVSREDDIELAREDGCHPDEKDECSRDPEVARRLDLLRRGVLHAASLAERLTGVAVPVWRVVRPAGNDEQRRP
jgi:hypothetical protein